MIVDASTRLIAVRNQKQAREWSLALLSQGIESTIVEDDRSGALALEVDAGRSADALRILKIYHIENRGWGWQHELPVVHLSFSWTCVGWAAFLALIHYFATLPGSRLTAAGVLSRSVVTAGEWWRLFTAITLHEDIGHLASNLAAGTLLMGLSMGRSGTGIGLLGPWLAATLANLGALFVYGRNYQSLGASGMVLAALGVLTASGAFEVIRRQPGWKSLFATLSSGLMLFVMTGSNPASDLVVHLGGFVFGIAIGGAIELMPRRIRDRSWFQWPALAAVLATTLTAWFCALVH